MIRATIVNKADLNVSPRFPTQYKTNFLKIKQYLTLTYCIIKLHILKEGYTKCL